MLTAIRKRMTWTNVAMTLALVFAMTGGAYAAKKYLITSTKQISPNVLKQLAGKAGPAGAQGPTGPAGPQGPAGTNGKDGLNGKDGTNGTNGTNGKDGAPGTPGESVTVTALSKGNANCKEGGAELSNKTGTGYACNGEAAAGGGYPETLPSGKTETGTWFVASGSGKGDISFSPTEELIGGNISFAIPLTKELNGAHVILVSGAPGEHCENTEHPGTASLLNPEATPGYLCVYQSQEVHNLKEPLIEKPDFPIQGLGGAGVSGAVVYYFVTGEHAHVNGTWAVAGE